MQPFEYSRTRLARSVVIASYVLLLLALLFGQPLSVVPLLLFAWGIATAHWRSHIWLCFVLLFYFLASINSLAEQPSWLGYTETTLVTVLFTAAMFYCRWSKSPPPESAAP